MPRCAVLGSPIAHSLSPAMHRAAYERLGLDDWVYDAFDVTEATLEHFLVGLDDSWRGLSLTMPLKRTVLPLLDDIGATARRVGSVNTVLRDGGRLVGHNTDVGGAAEAMLERGLGAIATARVLGAGATAASVGAALAGLGTEAVDLRLRDLGRGHRTIEVLRSCGLEVTTGDLDRAPDDQVDLLVSTVPATFFDSGVDSWVTSAEAVFDVVYDPWPTPLSAAAKGAGLPFVSGLDLLAHQASLQVVLMTGREVSAHVLRDAATRQLGSGRLSQ